MASRDRNRSTVPVEGILSLGVLVVLFTCLMLVFWAKKRVEVPEKGLLINSATSQQFEQTLNLDAATAIRLVQHRDRVHGFDSTDQVSETLQKFQRSNATVQPSNPTRNGAATDTRHPIPDTRLLKRLIVRTPQQVSWHFWGGGILLLLAVFFLPPWLRSKVGGDPILISLAMLLSGLGVVLMFSIKDPLRDGVVYEHHLRGLALGIVVMTFLARLAPAARLRIRKYQYVWALGAMLLVAALFLVGSGPEGVKLRLLGFQPVELIKLCLVFFLASYLGDRADLIVDASKKWTPSKVQGVKRNDGRQTFALAIPRWQDMGPMLGMYGIALVMFLVIKDMGPGVLLFMTFLAVLYLTTGRGVFVGIGGVLLLIAGFLGFKAHIGVFPTRVDMWLSPFLNNHANGMHLGQAYWALSSGGVEGSGLGLGMPGFIPRPGSDMAFVSWTEETGLLGAWLVLTVYLVMVWRGLKIALRASTEFDRALAFGLTALLGLQTLLIVGGVTGLIPLTGISLPFLSFGNSALVADFAIIGLLRGISAPPGRGIGRPAPRPEVMVASRRFGMVFALLLLGVIGLGRLGTMTLLHADELAVRPIVTPDADKIARPHINPRLLAMEHQIERGSIYDRNGRILATSREKELRKAAPNKRLAEQLASTHTRYYPFGAATAHLVGYLDPGIGGPFGMEKGWNEELRGFKHHADLLVDYRRRNLPGFVPRRGRDLHLTIDAVLQRQVQAALAETTTMLTETKTVQVQDARTGKMVSKTISKPKDRAAFVLMEPQSGNVLVAATLPSFDPNTLTPEQVQKLSSGPDAEEEHTFVNRAVAGVYPPGSTLKIATAACALDNLADVDGFTVVCNQVYPEIRWLAGGQTYVRRNTRDDEGDPRFGPLQLNAAFRVSSNIYFANLAVKLGPPLFRDTLSEKMGFHYVPSQVHFDADLPDIGYGQGRMQATPLEMARLAAAVSNDGKMMKARFLTSLTDPAGQDKPQDHPPTVLSQAMTPPTASRLREMMHTVITSGTAQGVFNDLPFAVAGKTGTAQNEQHDQEPHSWFVGFAPYGSPTSAPLQSRVAFSCVVENGGYGKRVAAVICHAVLKKLAVGHH